jgi:hypothetical protein
MCNIPTQQLHWLYVRLLKPYARSSVVYQYVIAAGLAIGLSAAALTAGAAASPPQRVSPAFITHVQARGLDRDTRAGNTIDGCAARSRRPPNIVVDVNFSCTAGWVGDFSPSDGTDIAGGALTITPEVQSTPVYFFGPSLLDATVAATMTLHGYGSAGLLARTTLRRGVVVSEYLCQISTSGNAACLVYRNGGFIALTSRSQSTALRKNGPNALSMTVRGDALLFRVNGHAVAAVHDRTGSALSAGQWGIAPSRYDRPFTVDTTRVVMKRP